VFVGHPFAPGPNRISWQAIPPPTTSDWCGARSEELYLAFACATVVYSDNTAPHSLRAAEILSTAAGT
jgi:hypothetical protein